MNHQPDDDTLRMLDALDEDYDTWVDILRAAEDNEPLAVEQAAANTIAADMDPRLPWTLRETVHSALTAVDNFQSRILADSIQHDAKRRTDGGCHIRSCPHCCDYDLTVIYRQLVLILAGRRTIEIDWSRTSPP